MSEIGFLTMAFGHERFFRQAENLALSLKRHMPGIPLALVTDRHCKDRLFDIVIPMKPVACMGVVQKLDLFIYSPFQETLFINSNSIATRPFPNELAAIRQYDFTPVVGRFLLPGQADPWIVDLAAVLDRLGGESFPKFNGGVCFFKKCSLAEKIFSLARALRDEASVLGIKNFDKAGPNDETLFGLALSQARVSRLYDDHGKLMRTPLNMIGKLQIDALGGGCSFNKEGAMVDPAICHFPGEWSLSPEYKTAEYTLRKGQHPHPLWQMGIRGWHRVCYFGLRLKRKVARLLVRCFPISVESHFLKKFSGM